MATHETKFFEVRDEGTFIPVFAIKVSRADGYLARRAGYGEDPCVMLGPLTDGACRSDPYGHTGRTYPVAHKYIEEHFDELEDGAVVDVRFILGEATAPATSEAEGRF
jgi:hypothetical protein